MKKNDEVKESECPDDTLPVLMKEGKCNRKDDKNEKNDEGKQAECPYGTPPVVMEEGLSNKKDDNNEKMITKKSQNAQMTLPLLIWSKVKKI